MNPKCFCTGLVLPFTHKRTNPKWKHPDLVMSPEILNPDSKVETLNPQTFESGKFCRVNAFLSNPDIFPPAIFWVCGITKMMDPAIQRNPKSQSYWWPLMASAGSLLVLSQVQAVFKFLMGNATFLRNQKGDASNLDVLHTWSEMTMARSKN